MYVLQENRNMNCSIYDHINIFMCRIMQKLKFHLEKKCSCISQMYQGYIRMIQKCRI